MSISFRYLVSACIILFLAGTPSTKAESQGSMEGRLKIVSPRAVEPSDDMPRPAVAPETYAKFSLIILNQDGQKQIARVIPDENGYYRVALPPGAYVLDVQDRTAKRVRAKPQPFTVISNQTVRVDMDIIDTDHWRVRSPQSFRPD
jgi:hypothetical protein